MLLSRRSPMAHLELRYSEYEDYVDVSVDGCLFSDILETAARQAGQCDGVFDEGMSWRTLNHEVFRTVFDDVCDAVGDHGDRILANCGCGEIACGGISARVVTTETSVTLSDFRRWPQSLPPLPSISFDRAQFFAEVRRMSVSFPPDMLK
jgi:hypothetical protein